MSRSTVGFLRLFFNKTFYTWEVDIIIHFSHDDFKILTKDKEKWKQRISWRQKGMKHCEIWPWEQPDFDDCFGEQRGKL